jgi:TPR repeat protein
MTLATLACIYLMPIFPTTGSFVTHLALALCRFPHARHLSLPQPSSKLPRHVLCRMTSALTSHSPEALFHSSEVFSRENDHISAAIALAAAVRSHHPRAHAALSWLLQEGRRGVDKNYEAAYTIALAGQRMGCTHSKGALAACLAFGRGVSVDRDQALRLARESAAGDSPYGLAILGYMIDMGEGVRRDAQSAVACYARAAHVHGLADAQNSLGSMLESGEGAQQSKEQAAVMYGLAAAQGLAPAMFNLAALYDNGEGVKKDEHAAASLYMQAASQGHRGAQFTIGFMFERGMGIVKSRSSAVRWYRAAASQGDALAQQALHRLGLGWQ